MQTANITQLMNGLCLETGEAVQFRLILGADELWTAAVFGAGNSPLLDPNGDGVFLTATDEDAETAVAQVNALCAIRPPITEHPVYRRTIEALQGADEIGGPESTREYIDLMQAVAVEALNRARAAGAGQPQGRRHDAAATAAGVES